MIEKKKPRCVMKHDEGNGGYGDFGRDYFVYYCATCGKQINFYRQENACENCGTFHDWGKSEPHIVVRKTVEWD